MAKAKKRELAKPVIDNFTKTMAGLVPEIINLGSSPLPGDMFWYKKKNSTFLCKRFKTGSIQNLLHLNGIHFPVPIRLAVPYRVFVGECSNRELSLLSPEICIDTSNFSTIVSCDMERSSVMARLVSNMIKKDML